MLPDGTPATLDNISETMKRSWDSSDTATNPFVPHPKVKSREEIRANKGRLGTQEDLFLPGNKTPYFETKFDRPVTLDEFVTAVVPKGTDRKIVSALKGAGLKVSTYKRGDYDDRKRAVKKAATEEVRFSAEERDDNRITVRNESGFTMTERERREVADYLKGDNYTSELTGNEFPVTEKGNPIDIIANYYKEKYNGKVDRPSFGTVLLNKRGVGTSLSHYHNGERRATKVVYAAFAAVPEIIKEGRIIDHSDNWRGRGYEGYVIAAPIKVGKRTYIGTVVITKGGQAANFRFYLHKVNQKENLLGGISNIDFESKTRQGDIAKVLKNILSPNNNSENVNFSVGERVSEAERRTETFPTEGQKEAGNYRKGHVTINGFRVTIENPKGSVRRGTSPDGKGWESVMRNTYGELRGTEGVDGDPVDVFLSNDIDGWDGRRVFVIDQYSPDGAFDEHKVMLGYNGIADAWRDYLSNYEDGWEDGRRLDVYETSTKEFRDWLSSSHRKTKPFGDYSSVTKLADDTLFPEAEARQREATERRETVADAENPENDTRFSARVRAETADEARERLGAELTPDDLAYSF